MKESEKKYIVRAVNYKAIIKDLQGVLNLRHKNTKTVKTLDYYFDTSDFYFYKNDICLRVRQKAKEYRATLKTPINLDNKGILHRNEIKLKFYTKSIEEIKIFLSNLSLSLTDKKLLPIITVNELSQEVNIKNGLVSLALSNDFVAYTDVKHLKNIYSENILEIEDHGIGIKNLKKACLFIEQKYNLISTQESKYVRAVNFLKLYKG